MLRCKYLCMTLSFQECVLAPQLFSTVETEKLTVQHMGLQKSLHKNIIKDFFSKCDQIRRKLRIWSHLLKKLWKTCFLSAVRGFSVAYKLFDFAWNYPIITLRNEFSMANYLDLEKKVWHSSCVLLGDLLLWHLLLVRLISKWYICEGNRSSKLLTAKSRDKNKSCFVVERMTCREGVMTRYF